MEEESPGVLLIGMRSAGLYRFNTHTGELTVFRTSRPEQEMQIPSNYISSILSTRSGDVWVSTYGGGIFQLDKRGGVLRRVTFPLILRPPGRLKTFHSIMVFICVNLHIGVG